MPHRRVRAWICRAVALLALCAVSLTPVTAAAQAQAQAQQAVLARGQEDLAAGAMLFRIVESALPAGQPGVTHAHASGFDYAVEGTHGVTVAGVERLASQGQATWVGPMQEHTHASLNQAGMRFWFYAFRPAATRGAPPSWPYPTTRIRGESEDVQVVAGTYELVLSEIRLPRPGDAAGGLARTGVAGVAVVDGEARFGGQPFPPEGIVVQRAGDARAFTNAGSGPARLLVMSVSPAATRLPQTGGPTPALPVGVAAAAGLTVLGALGARARRRVGRVAR